MAALMAERLGPASAERVGHATAEQAASALQGCDDLLDAALTLLHRALTEGGPDLNRERREFHGFIYQECLHRRGVTAHYPRIRSTYETHDLLSEVLMDLLEPSSKVEFFGLVPFCSLVVMRMAWRASEISRRMQNRGVPSLELDSRPGDSETSQDISAQSEDISNVQAALGQLHPRERTLLEHYLEGVSSAAIGEMMDMKPAAVRKAIQRAMVHLRARLGGSQ